MEGLKKKYLDSSPEQKFTLTGYSLGCNLATSLKIMQPDLISAVYTFNGAGIGTIQNEHPTDVTLNALMQAFRQRRENGSADWFAHDAGLLSDYSSLRSAFNGNSTRNNTITVTCGNHTRPHATGEALQGPTHA